MGTAVTDCQRLMTAMMLIGLGIFIGAPQIRSVVLWIELERWQRFVLAYNLSNLLDAISMPVTIGLRFALGDSHRSP